MKRLLSRLLCFSFILLLTCSAHSDDYEKRFEIKQGMHETAVNLKYGMPLEMEKLKSGFLPIPKKKALYKIDESTYIIIKFFSGRINEITILEDVTQDEASSMFKGR